LERKAVSGIMLTLLLASMLALACSVQPAKAEPTIWTVDDDGPADFSSIQEAINSLDVKHGDTIYVYNGTYYEHVVVNKTVSIIGENRSTTVIDGSGKGTVVYLTASNVGVSGFTLQNARAMYAGIYLADDANNNTISDNTMTNNEAGILIRSSGNTITENRIKKNRYGMYLMRCSNNVLSSNNISENIYNFWVGGYVLSDYIHNIDTSNLVNDKPVYYFVNQRNLVVDPSTFPEIGYLGLVNSTDIVVKNLSLTKNAQGVLFAYTTSSTIMNINASHNDRGIYLVHSSDNTIIRNTLRDNIDGVTSLLSDDNNISGNTISSNRAVGIGLTSSSSNTIIGNNVSENGDGIQIASSNNNILYHNNFVNNTDQVSSFASTNQWDDGYPSGGNYWSDYEDRYPNAEELDNSGIWDTPYVIDENNQDKYPLVNPWSPRVASVITISAEPTAVAEGSNVTVSGAISPVRVDVDVTIYYRLFGGIEEWSPLVTVKTDTNGNYAYIWKTTQAGTYELKASWLGDEETLGAESEVIIVSVWAVEKPLVITATIDIDPDILNLKSKGRWITAYIELPEAYNASDINILTVKLNGEIQAELHPTEIGDYDTDGITDLMVKFNRQDLIAILSVGEATLTITGKVNDTPFEGTDTISVIGE